MQYIEQQNEVIRSLRERIKSFEENAEDSISKEREVCLRGSTMPLIPTPIARTGENDRKSKPGACTCQLGLVPSPKPAAEQQRDHFEVSSAGCESCGSAEGLVGKAAADRRWPIRAHHLVLGDRLFFMLPFTFLFLCSISVS